MSRKKLSLSAIFPGLPERIKEIRKRLGSQEMLADRLLVQKSTISRYEGGRVPDTETLKKIAEIGNTTVEWLLYGEKRHSPPAAGEEISPLEKPQPGALGPPGYFSAVDTTVLAKILEGMEIILQERGVKLTPVRQAHLMSILYDQFQETGQVPDRAAIREVLSKRLFR